MCGGHSSARHVDASAVRARTIEVTSTIINKTPSSRASGRHEATEHLVRKMSNCEFCDGGGGRGVDGAYGYAILRLFAVVWASIYHITAVMTSKKPWAHIESPQETTQNEYICEPGIEDLAKHAWLRP